MIFIIILVLFTIAYASKPIINVSANVNIKFPLLPNGKQLEPDINESIKAFLYMNYITTNDNSITNSAKINYSEINSTASTVSTFFNYICIGTSVLMGLVIILSFVGLKGISYIPLSLSQLVMITFSLLIVIIYSTHYLTDILTDYINSLAGVNLNIPGVNETAKVKISNTNINYDIGGIFITLSSALLIVSHIFYSVLG